MTPAPGDLSDAYHPENIPTDHLVKAVAEVADEQPMLLDRMLIRELLRRFSAKPAAEQEVASPPAPDSTPYVGLSGDMAAIMENYEAPLGINLTRVLIGERQRAAASPPEAAQPEWEVAALVDQLNTVAHAPASAADDTVKRIAREAARALTEQARRLALAKAVVQAAEALHLCEDFEEPLSMCEQCAPRDPETYQAKRRTLYDALVQARATPEPATKEGKP
jgi:ElaB/YqjD/DUF883 family membrane-anchored ribosome-binding protein